jgi:hypothetical protein
MEAIMTDPRATIDTARPLYVGQKLFYVFGRDGRVDPSPRTTWVTVEKIGTKWATLGRNMGRINKRTWHVDDSNYTSGDICYASEEEWAAQMAADKAWSTWRYNLACIRPQHVTVEDIAQLVELTKKEDSRIR